MPKEIFRTQILILGLIDYFADTLKNEDRKETRDNLLAAIQVTLTNKLLENAEVSESLRVVLENLPKSADLDTILKTVQQFLQNKSITMDMLSLLKGSAKTVLQDFASSAQRPDLKSMIIGVL